MLLSQIELVPTQEPSNAQGIGLAVLLDWGLQCFWCVGGAGSGLGGKGSVWSV
jgi:hypothetical protein